MFLFLTFPFIKYSILFCYHVINKITIFYQNTHWKPNLKIKKEKSRLQAYHLHSNFPFGELHLLEVKLNLLYLSEIGINNTILLQELATPGYSNIIAKYDHLNCNSHIAYIKDRFPCDSDTKNENPDLSYM